MDEYQSLATKGFHGEIEASVHPDARYIRGVARRDGPNMLQLLHLEEALHIATMAARDVEVAIRNADDTCRREPDAAPQNCHTFPCLVITASVASEANLHF